ncbi:MAG: MBL fold metallo-hydrolase [Oscillospiraceae bacterium]|nr:MBL fold metallo-hydrolase [Oscillospiraceae bacterium]
MTDFEVIFLGTNGSCAYNNGKRIKYGTNTLCVAVKAGNETLIFDSGSGICGFNQFEEYQNTHLNLFFSHYHVDHLSGLLFFPELFNEKVNINIYGSESNGRGVNDVINNFLSAPLYPVGIDAFKAKLNFNTIKGGDMITLSDNIIVKMHSLSHPDNSLGYRVEYDGKSFCYCTDIELAEHKNDRNLKEFMRGADLLVLDSHFDDGKVIKGWGHSSWIECAEWAEACEAERMALFHYGFMLNDDDIDEMEKKAKKIFTKTFAARDGSRVKI